MLKSIQTDKPKVKDKWQALKQPDSAPSKNVAFRSAESSVQSSSQSVPTAQKTPAQFSGNPQQEAELEKEKRVDRKPGSVSHPRWPVIIYLGCRLLEHLDAAYPKVITRRTATAFCLALLRMGFTKAAEVTLNAGGLLLHLFTLTTHYPSSRSAV